LDQEAKAVDQQFRGVLEAAYEREVGRLDEDLQGNCEEFTGGQET
jgi:hypothetical protein